MQDRSQPLSISYLKLAWLITCSMFNLTVPHFQDSKQKRNCKLLTMKSCTRIINLPRMTTGPLDRTILYRTISSPADRTIARWPVSPAVLPQATSRENYRTCTFRNFLPNQLACFASHCWQTKIKKLPRYLMPYLQFHCLWNLFHISNDLFWNFVNICKIFQKTPNWVLDTNIAEHKNHIKDLKCRRLDGR